MPSSSIPNTRRNLVMMLMILLLSPLPHSCVSSARKNIQNQEIIFFSVSATSMPLIQRWKPSLSFTNMSKQSQSTLCVLPNVSSICLFSYCITLARDIISQLGINDLQTSSFQASLHTAAKFISLECKSYRVKLLLQF